MSVVRSSATVNPNQDQTVIFYHADCLDGFMAAFTLWLDFRDEAEYYPVQYGQPPPNVTGKVVYLLDFSYPKAQLMQMISQAKSFIIIDHHDTAIKDLEGIPKMNKIFDQKECAATLVWKYQHSNTGGPMPLVYRYIRARDLWTDDMPHRDEFAAAFSLVIRNQSDGEYNFKLAEKYLDDKEIPGLLEVGHILIAFQKISINKCLDHADFCPIRIPNRNYDPNHPSDESPTKLVIVAYINTPILISDIADDCLKEYPFVDFCVCYYIDSIRQETQFCLRSSNDREDVSLIAKDFGGGGLRNAAGFRSKDVKCRLAYEHLDPIPLNCVHRNTELVITSKNSSLLNKEYMGLLRRKFPGQDLRVRFSLDTTLNF